MDRQEVIYSTSHRVHRPRKETEASFAWGEGGGGGEEEFNCIGITKEEKNVMK